MKVEGRSACILLKFQTQASAFSSLLSLLFDVVTDRLVPAVGRDGAGLKIEIHLEDFLRFAGHGVRRIAQRLGQEPRPAPHMPLYRA